MIDDLARPARSGIFEMAAQKVPDALGIVTIHMSSHIDEAVMLSDRVAVFSPAPGRLLEVVPVPAPRPRDTGFRRDPRFVETAAHIRGLLFR